MRSRNVFNHIKPWENGACRTSFPYCFDKTINRERPNLLAVSDERASKKTGGPDKWSQKEELGHLIDSAANNHIRFVLATLDGEFRGQGYAQDDWVRAHGYRDISWSALVDLWHGYNLLLAHVVELIPGEHLGNTCVIGGSIHTLRFVIEDYVLHMRHHLDHILFRDPVTPYPAITAAV
jgi:hypothetical protein